MNHRIPAGDAAWQQEMLNGVARTFALTLRPLPEALRGPVVNLYLLCRIADTIEDDPVLDLEERAAFGARFVAAVEGDGDARTFGRDLAARLSGGNPAERALAANTPRALGITARFDAASRKAMERCVRIMTGGMVEFARLRGPGGLADRAALDRYCYFVAGVVGETLTALYCAYSPKVAARREELAARAHSFGQGLQLVNILNDVGRDRRRGVCWLPADLFRAHGVDLATLGPGPPSAGFAAGIREMAAIARRHLDRALEYTLLLPPCETGIRRSCLWPLGLAALNLRRIHRGAEGKLPRRAVHATVLLSSLFSRSDRALRGLYRACVRGLP